MPEVETKPFAKPKMQAKAETLNVYIWRNRQRGFVVVVAPDLEEARAAATAQQPNLQSFVTREPEQIILAAVGEVAYLRQR